MPVSIFPRSMREINVTLRPAARASLVWLHPSSVRSFRTRAPRSWRLVFPDPPRSTVDESRRCPCVASGPNGQEVAKILAMGA